MRHNHIACAAIPSKRAARIFAEREGNVGRASRCDNRDIGRNGHRRCDQVNANGRCCTCRAIVACQVLVTVGRHRDAGRATGCVGGGCERGCARETCAAEGAQGAARNTDITGAAVPRKTGAHVFTEGESDGGSLACQKDASV